jgi:hypothetical protein
MSAIHIHLTGGGVDERDLTAIGVTSWYRPVGLLLERVTGFEPV